MIKLANDINRIHFFGEKLILYKNNEIIRLNKSMSDIARIVMNCEPCSIDVIVNALLNELNITYTKDDITTICDMVSNFINDTKVGKSIFNVKNEDRNIPCDLILTGEKDKYYPTNINLELTNRCNLKCTHCYKNAGINKNVFLSFDKLKMLCEFLRKSNASYSLTGGECTLHPQFNDIINYLYDISNIDMVTNGTFISRIDRSILKKISLICISIYGLNNEEYYHSTGIANGMDLLKRSIDCLLSSGCKYNMTTVLDVNKINKIEEYVEFAFQCGANSIQFGIPSKSGRLERFNENNSVWNLTESDIKNAYRTQRKLEQKYLGKIKILTWDRDVYSHKYGYKDPYNPSNFYEPHCMKCGAGVWHWVVSENFSFRPCALLPESYEPAVFSFEKFKSFVLGNSRIEWDKIMHGFECWCQSKDLVAGDYCENFTNFLHEDL